MGKLLFFGENSNLLFFLLRVLYIFSWSQIHKKKTTKNHANLLTVQNVQTVHSQVGIWQEDVVGRVMEAVRAYPGVVFLGGRACVPRIIV